MSRHYKGRISYNELLNMNLDEYNYLKYLMWKDLTDPKKQEELANEELVENMEEMVDG